MGSESPVLAAKETNYAICDLEENRLKLDWFCYYIFDFVTCARWDFYHLFYLLFRVTGSEKVSA